MYKIIYILLLGFLSQVARGELSFGKGDRVLLYGNSFIERLQAHGLFEASLQLAHPGKNLEFRSLAWTGDEVGYRLRPERYVNHLNKLLTRWPAKVVVLGFGINESFAGPEGIGAFRSDLDGYLREMERRHPGAEIVVLSPIATEDLKHPHYPEVRRKGIRRSGPTWRSCVRSPRARRSGSWTCLPQAWPRMPIRKSRLHPMASISMRLGYGIIASHLARELLGAEVHARVDQTRAGMVARAVRRKAGHVATVVRPVNTVLYFGVRGRAHEYNAEIPRYHELIARSDARIHAMLQDAAIVFDPEPLTLPPLVKRDPAKLPSPEEMLKSFRVAEGYEVNLFASEQQFPELRNPEQIAFDSQGTSLGGHHAVLPRAPFREMSLMIKSSSWRTRIVMAGRTSPRCLPIT